MHITHSYLGYRKRPEAKLAFFLLTEDYINEQRRLMEQLQPLLDEFARNLGSDLGLVVPFPRDIASTRESVLTKDWPRDDLNRIGRTPGLLAMAVDFADFNPKAHDWLHVSFRDGMNDYGDIRVFEVKALLDSLVALAESGMSLKGVRDKLESDIRAGILKRGFSAEIGAFGVSFDLSAGVEYLKRCIRRE